MTIKPQVRVLTVLGSGHVGGIEKLSVSLFEHLRSDDRVDLHLYFRSPDGPFYDKALSSGPEDAVHSGKGLRSMAGLFSEFDVVHLQGFTPSISMAAILSRTALVYHEHSNFAFRRELTWKERIKWPLRRMFVRSSRVARTIAISQFVNSAAAKHYGSAWQRKSVVVRNGVIRPLPAAGASTTRMDRELSLGYIGRLVGFKRVDRFLDVLAKGPEDWTGVVVGEGPLENHLRQTTRMSGLDDRVRFSGFVDDIESFFDSIDCLLLPSEREPFGLVTLEAWDNAVPVFVFSDGGGAAEIVRDIDPFFVCDNPEQMVDRILSFSNDNERQRQFLVNLESVRTAFSIDRYVSDMADIFVSVIEEGPRPPDESDE